MISAMLTIVLLAILVQVESGYEYQVPKLAFQQHNQHIVPFTGHNTQQSISYTSFQGNYIGNQFHGQNQQNSYQSSLNGYNYYSGFGNNIQSGSVPQNVQQSNSIGVQQVQSQNVHQTNSIGAQPVQPIVKKHVYFHVAPPDEDQPIRPQVTPNKKKSVNIVFIKLPSQRPTYFNPHAVEAKTLIYVLVKKPEDHSQVLSQQSSSNHEVFYVKYKSSAVNAESQINSSVPQQRPGLINGQ